MTNRYTAHAAVEKFAFTSAYYIRKLMEANRLSDELESNSIELLTYPAYVAQIPIERFAIISLREYYNFRRVQKIRVPLDKYCNLLIHSFLFKTRFWKDDARVFFNSDKTKDTTLYEISLQNLIAIAEDVGKDEICSYATKQIKPGVWKIKKSRKKLTLGELSILIDKS